MEIISVLWSKIWILIISGVLLAGIAFFYSYAIKTPVYTSSTSVYILNKRDENTALSYNDTMVAAQLTKDYQQLITSRTVFESVINGNELNMTVKELASKVSVEQVEETRIIKISVKDTDPKMAQFLAGEVREAAALHVKNVTDVEAVNKNEEANLPSDPSGPNVKVYTVLGFLLGFLLSSIIVIIVYLLDDTIKTVEDVEKYLGLSNLAIIPERESERNNRKSKKGKKKQPVGKNIKKGV